MNINVNNPGSDQDRSKLIPDPEVKPKGAKTRRNFSANQKLTILAEIDDLKRGETGAYLRRKGLYSSTVSSWRKERSNGELDAAKPKKRGARPKSAESKELSRLEKENLKLQKEVERGKLIIDVQKKLCQLYGVDSMTGESLT